MYIDIVLFSPEELTSAQHLLCAALLLLTYRAFFYLIYRILPSILLLLYACVLGHTVYGRNRMVCFRYLAPAVLWIIHIYSSSCSSLCLLLNRAVGWCPFLIDQCPFFSSQQLILFWDVSVSFRTTICLDAFVRLYVCAMRCIQEVMHPMPFYIKAGVFSTGKYFTTWEVVDSKVCSNNRLLTSVK